MYLDESITIAWTGQPAVAEVHPAVGELFHTRTVPFAFHRGARLRFDLATTVFSSAGVDAGSALLLRHLQGVDLPPAARVLDLGSGHGVLGLVLAALDPTRRVTLVDRDALACHFTARNLALNGFDPATATIGGSLGYDGLPATDPYDLVVSNLPGKAGDAVIANLVVGPGTGCGRALWWPWWWWPLWLSWCAGLCIGPRPRSWWTGATRPTRYSSPASLGPPPTPTGRTVSPPVSTTGRPATPGRRSDLRARTVTGLDEFDSLAHATILLRGALRGVRAGACTVVNPVRDTGPSSRPVGAEGTSSGGPRSPGPAGHGPAPGRPWRGRSPPEGAPGTASSGPMVGAGADDRSGPALPALHFGLTPPADGTPNLIIHADDKVHTPWLVHELRTWLAAAPSGPGGERQLILTGRAGLLGRLEVDLLARTRGRLADKANRHGYRVVPLPVPGLRRAVTRASGA